MTEFKRGALKASNSAVCALLVVWLASRAHRPRHPDFVRKIQGSSDGEELFAQMGLFGDDLDRRYFTAQWERVPGARAIVDPELASGQER